MGFLQSVAVMIFITLSSFFGGVLAIVHPANPPATQKLKTTTGLVASSSNAGDLAMDTGFGPANGMSIRSCAQPPSPVVSKEIAQGDVVQGTHYLCFTTFEPSPPDWQPLQETFTIAYPVPRPPILTTNLYQTAQNEMRNYMVDFGDGRTATFASSGLSCLDYGSTCDIVFGVSHTYDHAGVYIATLSEDGQKTSHQVGFQIATPEHICDFNGVLVPNDLSVTAYNLPQPNPRECQSEQRRCVDGALSGSFPYLTPCD